MKYLLTFVLIFCFLISKAQQSKNLDTLLKISSSFINSDTLWSSADSPKISWIRGCTVIHTSIEQDYEDRIFLKMANGDILAIRGRALKVKRIKSNPNHP